jgi:hypothetical protein
MTGMSTKSALIDYENVYAIKSDEKQISTFEMSNNNENVDDDVDDDDDDDNSSGDHNEWETDDDDDIKTSDNDERQYEGTDIIPENIVEFESVYKIDDIVEEVTSPRKENSQEIIDRLNRHIRTEELFHSHRQLSPPRNKFSPKGNRNSFVELGLSLMDQIRNFSFNSSGEETMIDPPVVKGVHGRDDCDDYGSVGNSVVSTTVSASVGATANVTASLSTRTSATGTATGTASHSVRSSATATASNTIESCDINLWNSILRPSAPIIVSSNDGTIHVNEESNEGRLYDRKQAIKPTTAITLSANSMKPTPLSPPYFSGIPLTISKLDTR